MNTFYQMTKKIIKKIISNVEKQLEKEAEISKKLESQNRLLKENLDKMTKNNSK